MVDLKVKVPALEKLLDYTASGIGAVAGPMLARWKSRKAADARLIEAKAEVKRRRVRRLHHRDGDAAWAARRVLRAALSGGQSGFVAIPAPTTRSREIEPQHVPFTRHRPSSPIRSQC